MAAPNRVGGRDKPGHDGGRTATKFAMWGQRKSLKRRDPAKESEALNLDFVPPDLEFVPSGLDFVPENLDFLQPAGGAPKSSRMADSCYRGASNNVADQPASSPSQSGNGS